MVIRHLSNSEFKFLIGLNILIIALAFGGMFMN